jgi:ribosomal protein L2
MGIRKLNPVTPGTRHKVITDFEGVTTNVCREVADQRNHQERWP